MHRRIEAYLAYLAAVRNLSPRTVESYGNDLASWEAFLALKGRDVEDASTQEVRGFMAARVQAGFAASSVNRALSAVKGLYRYFQRFPGPAGSGTDPARDVEGLPAGRPLPRFLFEDEMGSSSTPLRGAISRRYATGPSWSSCTARDAGSPRWPVSGSRTWTWSRAPPG